MMGAYRVLEAKVPPPLLAGLVAAAMWVTALLSHSGRSEIAWRTAGAAVGLLGLAVVVLGVRKFLNVGTTINPVRLEAASMVVTTGIFRHTRNPMYLGMALLLAGWAVYLQSPWTIAGPVLFVAFLNRFQIMPEERILRAKFGHAYEDYRRRVRRWV